MAVGRGGKIDHLFLSNNDQKDDAVYPPDANGGIDDTELNDSDTPLSLVLEEPSTLSHDVGGTTAAMRVERLRCAHFDIRGITNFDDRSESQLSHMLADMRHWCDVHGVDFHRASDLSYQEYCGARQVRDILAPGS